MTRSSTLVILNGTLIDGAGNPPVPNEAIVIELRSDGCLRDHRGISSQQGLEK